jgi:hypothetical protein
MFSVLPSLKVPVAVICCVVPNAKELLGGVTAIETSVCATAKAVQATHAREMDKTARQIAARGARKKPDSLNSVIGTENTDVFQ